MCRVIGLSLVFFGCVSVSGEGIQKGQVSWCNPDEMGCSCQLNSQCLSFASGPARSCIEGVCRDRSVAEDVCDAHHREDVEDNDRLGTHPDDDNVKLDNADCAEGFVCHPSPYQGICGRACNPSAELASEMGCSTGFQCEPSGLCNRRECGLSSDCNSRHTCIDGFCHAAPDQSATDDLVSEGGTCLRDSWCAEGLSCVAEDAFGSSWKCRRTCEPAAPSCPDGQLCRDDYYADYCVDAEEPG